jgi:hypothetical protein
MDVNANRVMKSLASKHREPSRKILSNKLNKNVIHSNGAYYYKDSKGKYTILSGLLPSLKSCFWPNVNINKITKTPNVKWKKTKNEKKGEQQQPPRQLKGKGRFFGSLRGSKIHKQLEDFVFLDRAHYMKKHKGLHGWTKAILLYIESKGWSPILTEYNVYDAILRIGTSIDMICVNRMNGNLVILEFKTGYKDYFENYDGYMENSLFEYENSPLNWATMQLTFSIIMLLKQQEKVTNVRDKLTINDIEAYIIRIDDVLLEKYDVDNVFINGMTSRVYNDMAQHRQRVNRGTTTAATK